MGCRETLYLNSKQDILTVLNTAENTFDSVVSCYESKIASGTLTNNQKSIANNRISSASATVNTLIAPRQATTTQNIATSNLNLGLLDVIRDDALFTTTEEELTLVALDYGDLTASDILHLGASFNDQFLLNEATDFSTDANNKLTACNAFPPITTP